MAEIRCPMCGKPTPLEEEVCQFCQARLRPMFTAPISLPDSPQAPAPDQPSEAEHSDPGLPGWLRGVHDLSEDVFEAGAENASTPPGEPGSSPDSQVDDQAQAEGEDVPDWLNRIRELSRLDRENQHTQILPGYGWVPEAEVQPESGEDDLPDWLGDVRNFAEFIDTPAPEPEITPEPQGEPDWLERLRRDLPASEKAADQQAEEPDPAGQPAGETEDSSPWSRDAEDPLHGLTAILSWDEDTPGTPPSAPAIPEWNPEISPLDLPSLDHLVEAEPPEQAAPAVSQPAPEWVPAEAAPAPSAQAEELEPEADQPPEWLAQFQADLEASPPSPETEPFRAEIPDWMAEFKPASLDEQLEEADGSDFTGDEEELEPAVLPAWVQAMRPVETVLPEPAAVQEEEPVEVVVSSGPLAGLSGILPAEDAPGVYRHPPLYSTRLEVTENQQRYAQVLQDLLAAESTPRPVRRPAQPVTHRLPRLVIAVLLLVAILYPLIAQRWFFPVPNLYSLEMLNLRDAVNALPAGQPVLVVVDYEPALSGEMEAASAAVMDNLMAASARLTLVSTSPTGPAMAEKLLSRVRDHPASYHLPYSSPSHLVNLGYVAGGPAGIANFALAPRQAVPGLLPDGSSAWELPALLGVRSIDDFSKILILTDNIETGRTWIEQLRPGLDADSLLFVTSAQAAPALRPYVDAGQVTGMVSGLAGGAAYEQITQHPGPATSLWGAFQASMLATIILILVGGLGFLLDEVITHRRALAEEEA
jgi:hypothetical protein